MSRLDSIKQHLENLASPDHEKVKASYEWITANARENTRALVALIDAQKPASVTGAFMSKVDELLQDLRSDDAERVQSAQGYLNEPGKAAALIDVLFKEVNGHFDLIGLLVETQCAWIMHAKKHNWKITQDLKSRIDATFKAADAYMEIKEK